MSMAWRSKKGDTIDARYMEAIAKAVGKPESFAAFYLIISGAYPETAQITGQFNSGVKMLKEKGGDQKILQYYNMPEYFAVP